MVNLARSTQAKRETLRVAYFLNAFPKLSETFVLNEILQARIQGINIHIYSMARTHEETIHKDAIPLLRDTIYVSDVGRIAKIRYLVRLLLTHPLRLLKTVRFVRGKKDKRLMWSLKQAIYLAGEVSRLCIHHIHAHFALEAAEHAMLTGMLTGTPYSVAAHAVDIYVHQRLLREKMEYAKFIVTECCYNKEYLEDYNGRIPRERIHVIRLGIDPAIFIRNEEAGGREGSQGSLRIVSVARLVEKKGLSYLIDALALLKREGLDLQASIVGDGPERMVLTELIDRHRLGSSVWLVGPKDRDGVQGYLGQADVFVLPCIVATNGDRDATPTVLAEAMAMGIPVIATTVAGIPEIMPETAGILVPPRDSIALAGAIKSIYRMGHIARNEMGARGREYVLKNCNLARETQRLVELFVTPHRSGQ